MDFSLHKQNISSKKKKDWFWAYLMIFPNSIGLLIFYIIPFMQTFFYSFTDLGAFGVYSYVGLQNFKKLFSDAIVGRALINTSLFTIISVPIGISLSIFIALLLNSKIKGLTVYRTLYFLPAVTMPSVSALIWKWLYNADYGLINSILKYFSIQGPAWISNPKTALISVIIVSIWSNVGYNMIIFLAGLQGIPKSYYESASIEGAGALTKFFKITLPLLTPTIFFVLVMSLIHAFQMFDLIFILITEDSIAIENTQTIVYLFYKNAFMFHEKGYACAIAIILFFIIMIITILQLKLQKKWVNYIQ
jgi:multiple sugar transport system permease protein